MQCTSVWTQLFNKDYLSCLVKRNWASFWGENVWVHTGSGTIKFKEKNRARLDNEMSECIRKMNMASEEKNRRGDVYKESRRKEDKNRSDKNDSSAYEGGLR